MHSSLVCVRARACACVRSCVRACEFLCVFVHACVCLCLCASTSIRSAFGLRSRRFVQCDNSEIAEGTSAVVGNPYHLWPTACHALPGRREAQQSERRERSEPPLHRHRRRVCKLGYCANRCDRWRMYGACCLSMLGSMCATSVLPSEANVMSQCHANCAKKCAVGLLHRRDGCACTLVVASAFASAFAQRHVIPSTRRSCAALVRSE